ncbi:unnamed protein product [Cyprideis torosa]|uniref:Uncharacterized protein n=1 Tax=Cyprideis torosa TaxID=163714 RepID=A0A7R8ZSI2_9CRUS|nr:unnamed protein product [Cyprideis torosa]CAG0896097.1 unnamed protein product [Cyprideis torosa]
MNQTTISRVIYKLGRKIVERAKDWIQFPSTEIDVGWTLDQYDNQTLFQLRNDHSIPNCDTTGSSKRGSAQFGVVPLDGRPMKITYEGGATGGGTIQARVSPRGGRVQKQRGGGGFGGFRRGGGFGGTPRGGRSRGRGGPRGGGRGRGGARENKPTPTAEELDAELDAYINSA